jgi:hypothetical protein
VTEFSTTLLYLTVMPPRTPPEAVKTMMDAIVKLNTDPIYQMESTKLLGKAADFAFGPALQAKFLKTITPEASIREFVEGYIAKGFQDAGRR